MITDKEAAQKLGCSVSTARRWQCAWCEQIMLYVAKGFCGAIYERCNTEEGVKSFRENREKK